MHILSVKLPDLIQGLSLVFAKFSIMKSKCFEKGFEFGESLSRSANERWQRGHSKTHQYQNYTLPLPTNSKKTELFRL